MKILMQISFLIFSSSAFAGCYYDFTGAIAACQARAPEGGAGWSLIAENCSTTGEQDVKVRCLNPVRTWEANCGYYGPGVPVWNFEVCPNPNAPKASPKVIPLKAALQCGSVVKVDNQVLEESISLTGIPFDLVYSSDKVGGRKDWNIVNIPLTAAGYSTPSGVSSIKLDVKVAGQSINHALAPASNLSEDVSWDGKDGLGNPVYGSATTEVTVQEAYGWDTTGCRIKELGPGETLLISDPTTTYCGKSISPVKYSLPLGSVFSGHFGIGGWEISIHHTYDPGRKTLYLGDGNVTQTEYKTFSSGNVWIPSKDRSEIYIFDSNFRHIQTKSSLSGVIFFEFLYDSSGKIASVTDKNGLQTTLQYTSGKISSITSPYGQVTNIDTNSAGFITEVTNPASESYQMTYSSQGLLLTFEKPSGVYNTFTYDTNGKLLTDISSAGNSVTLTPGVYGGQPIISSASALGRTITNYKNYASYPYYYRTENYPDYTAGSYTENLETNYFKYEYANTAKTASYVDDTRFGAPFKMPATFSTTNANMVRGTSVSETSTLTTAGDPFSLSTLTTSYSTYPKLETSSYTAATKTLVQTSGANRTTTSVFTAKDDISQVQFASFTPIEFSYDSLGRLSDIDQGASRNTSFSYNSSNGLVASITNPLLQTTSFIYDLAGRVLSQTLPDARVISYSYDDNGNLTSVTPPGKPIHEMEYNDFDLLASYLPPTIALPSTGATTYTYNNDRQLTQVTRPNGQSMTLNYNSTTGKLSSISLPSGTRSFAINNVVQNSTSEDLVTKYFSYWGTFVRQEDVNDTAGSYSLYYNANMDFLPNSERLSIGVIDTTITSNYDYDGLITSAGSQAYTRSSATGLLTNTTLGSVTQDYSYSSTYGELSGILAKYSTANLYSETMTRDSLGRISSMTEQYGSGTSNVYTYTYDSAGRLTTVLKNGSAYSSYGYDSNSSRNTQTLSGTTTNNMVYDDQDRLTTFGTKTLGYNLNGEVTSIADSATSTTVHYGYDVFGNLKSVTLPTKTINYLVDAQNRRVVKKDGTTLIQRYIWNQYDQLIGIVDASGSLTSRFVYGSKSHSPDYMITASAEYQIVTNHLGSPVIVVNKSTGMIAQEIKYDEFGNIQSDSNPGFIPFGYAGCLYEQDTKLCRFGARDYDASIGRWLSKDPILFAGGDTNLYGYVLQDPINWIDSDGLSPNRPIMNPADDVLTKPGGFGGGGGFPRGGQKLYPVSGTSYAHTTFKYGPNGRISSYSTWTPNPMNPSGFDLQMRFDGTGKHGNIVGPHVHEPGSGVRVPNQCEFPSGY